MRRALVLVFVFACTGGKEQSADRAPATGSAVGRATPSDDELVSRWYDAMEKQIASDARRVATQRFASRDEVEQALTSLTPAGFRPRPEYFQALYDEAGPPEALARRLADYATAHGDDMERRAGAMLEHLKPLMQQVFENVQRQFPGP